MIIFLNCFTTINVTHEINTYKYQFFWSIPITRYKFCGDNNAGIQKLRKKMLMFKHKITFTTNTLKPH